MNPILALTARKAVVFPILRLCTAGILAGIFLLLCASTAAQSKPADPPSEILGTWEGQSK